MTEPEPPPSIAVPELRDYHQINAEIVRRLNRGETHVRLEGVERQRLLVAGLSGPWEATVELIGDAGPELAAGMDAPGIVVVCRGSSADGAGSGLKAGSLFLHGPTGTAVGYAQAGGLIVALGSVGPRAGLRMSGGELVLSTSAGPLAGEGQTGGRLYLPTTDVGPHAGWNARGGVRSTVDAALRARLRFS
ncbi:MAG: glutamate synthase [Paludisphaera borealis]|uniref:GltB/FmdC/FwdC-like GXGXG domain-containing protein n=1 Tax=Paludisphaera borealis TaxID=1387353 RepID=UPI00284A9CD6|nr:glutamate synthase [Paludisphaera borealis]MDR3617774.1 glutamate synthase [Paludisphaera borealis]